MRYIQAKQCAEHMFYVENSVEKCKTSACIMDRKSHYVNKTGEKSVKKVARVSLDKNRKWYIIDMLEYKLGYLSAVKAV